MRSDLNSSLERIKRNRLKLVNHEDITRFGMKVSPPLRFQGCIHRHQPTMIEPTVVAVVAITSDRVDTSNRGNLSDLH